MAFLVVRMFLDNKNRRILRIHVMGPRKSDIVSRVVFWNLHSVRG